MDDLRTQFESSPLGGSAIENGDEYHTEYWELLSLEIAFDGRCGETNRMLVNTCFDGDPSGIFGWGISYIEGTVRLSVAIEMSGSLKVTTGGLDEIGMGITLHW